MRYIFCQLVDLCEGLDLRAVRKGRARLQKHSPTDTGVALWQETNAGLDQIPILQVQQTYSPM
jgi:hypothetical protein